MKTFLFYSVFSFISLLAFAQENSGIHFTDSSWNQLLAEAKSEHKLIFMDAHTTWCGPCKWMDKNVFSKAEVAAVYNRNFINAYTDMEKGEGIELRKKYEVKAYPTFLFINGEGEVVHKAVGQSSIEEFIQSGLDAISPTRNLAYFQKNYETNKTKYDFISGYLRALKTAYETDMANAVSFDYLKQLNPDLLQERNNWKLIEQYISDASSPVFIYLVDHRQKFEKLYGNDQVDQKIYTTYLAWPQHYLHYSEDKPIVFDKEKFKDFLAQVEKSNYEKKDEIIAKSKLTVFAGLRDWKSYTKIVSRMIEEKIIPMNTSGAEELYSYANMVYRFGKSEPIAVSDATGFAKLISEEIPDLSYKNKATYLNLYADLLEASGKKQVAASVRKNIDQKKLAEAQKSNPFQQLIPQQKK